MNIRLSSFVWREYTRAVLRVSGYSRAAYRRTRPRYGTLYVYVGCTRERGPSGETGECVGCRVVDHSRVSSPSAQPVGQLFNELRFSSPRREGKPRPWPEPSWAILASKCMHACMCAMWYRTWTSERQGKELGDQRPEESNANVRREETERKEEQLEEGATAPWTRRRDRKGEEKTGERRETEKEVGGETRSLALPWACGYRVKRTKLRFEAALLSNGVSWNRTRAITSPIYGTAPLSLSHSLSLFPLPLHTPSFLLIELSA